MGPARAPRALPYLAALDGLRGLAIAAVLVYHADPQWLPGGMLGISVFFTLSGFLITSLLLTELEDTGRLDVPAFWLRRARRLVPASLAAVALIAVFVAAGLGALTTGLLADAVAALTWTANWRFVTDGAGYETLFADPSPFQHFWSLAVEEQLYVGLPLVALALLGRKGQRRWLFGAVVVAGIAASTIAAATLHVPGGAPSRAYFGTDARIAEPLVGVLLALLLVGGGGIRRLSTAATRVAGGAGVAALAGIALLTVELSTDDSRLYRGGFLAIAVLTAVVLVAATQTTIVARALAAPPLVSLGRISYGVYLFHWPIYLWVGDRLPELDRGPQLAIQVGATLLLASISHALLELPIRRRHRPAGVFTVGWANATVAVLALVAVTTWTAPASSGPSDLGFAVDAPAPPPPPAPTTATAPTPPPVELPRGGAVSGQQASPAPAPAAPRVPADQDPVVNGTPPGKAPGSPPEDPGAQLRVAVIGDSLGFNLANGLQTWGEERGDVVVYDLSISFCPLSRGGERKFDEYGDEVFPPNAKCSWWNEPWSERAEYFVEFQPDIVVIQASFNEILDRRLPEWDDWRRPGDPPYHQWLRDEYGSMFTALRSMAGDDTRFLLLNAVCADFARHERWSRVTNPTDRVDAMNQSVYPLMIEASLGDLFQEVCPDGEYSDEVYGIPDARPDGFHLSNEASAELARRWLGPLVIDTATDRTGVLGGV